MPSSGTKSTKPKPSEVASEAKRIYIPMIRDRYAVTWTTCSYIYHQPLLQINFTDRPLDLSPPVFYVSVGDPVDTALNWVESARCAIAFICAANDKRPGGDWETGVVGYEERLCRRSTLAACLATPADGSPANSHYPLPTCAGVLSQHVGESACSGNFSARLVNLPHTVVFRGPHDRYEKLPTDQWRALPVVSVPPPRWPKLTQNGTKYSFADEREMVKEKMRGALRICAYNNYSTVVIGNFGLGNGYRNPPQELAELWREVCLYDPDLRGRIRCVAFVFEDPSQSTTQLILDDIAKKAKGGGSSSSGRSKTNGSSSSSSSPGGSPADVEIFSRVFDNAEIQRFLAQPDARYGLSNLLA
ncbi:hypothetical protein MYCTH_2308648 [Thermothelomyces thermophilus ATCC 42464]|uniref:Microbial-type PARG catalytic domain-containing protein n=1 Tax=Thermothelomyces thermophilus (strain ATCC 42464 / BCRC 31852 / DSM 1799) TaxID=573729 RepID=G2QK31_THET4|nr:uncharacterized protein MYCTH_2308648 [Thermothelomyces thermophilus ATCC 42464]AEO59937.1 hypothetical protein MYCTH_2308648 [Thermothelomyces thermophilus ATCC 42464]